MPGRRAPAKAAGGAKKRADPTMKPGQKGAGKQYTKAQFTEFYGAAVAAKMWKKAGTMMSKKPAAARSPPRSRGPASRGPAKKAAGAAKRPDPTMKPGQKGAGKQYTKAQFAQFYGAELAKKMWLKAGKLLAKSAPPPRSRGPARKAPPAPAASKRADPTMKPGQKGAGKLYTKAQFTQFYGPQGGAKMWQKAGQLASKKKKAPAGPEKRADPTMKPGQKGANKQYTKAEFTKFYGAVAAKKMWLKAGSGKAAGAKGKKAAAPSATKRPDPTMKPGQKGAGKLYTKAQFTQFYGPQAGPKMWIKGGKLLSKKAAPAKKKAAAGGATKRADPTMKPGQKGAGKLYTKAQFTEFYGAAGGAKMWKKAGTKKSAAPAKKRAAGGGEQRRPDPTMKAGQKGAKKTYTKAQFTQFYGAEQGAKMWKKGGKLLK